MLPMPMEANQANFPQEIPADLLIDVGGRLFRGQFDLALARDLQWCGGCITTVIIGDPAASDQGGVAFAFGNPSVTDIGKAFQEIGQLAKQGNAAINWIALLPMIFQALRMVLDLIRNDGIGDGGGGPIQI